MVYFRTLEKIIANVGIHKQVEIGIDYEFILMELIQKKSIIRLDQKKIGCGDRRKIGGYMERIQGNSN